MHNVFILVRKTGSQTVRMRRDREKGRIVLSVTISYFLTKQIKSIPKELRPGFHLGFITSIVGRRALVVMCVSSANSELGISTT